MNYYFDIHILADPDFPSHQILTALYMRLHHSLVELRETEVGVSFPQYQRRPRKIGAILRLHGSEKKLEVLLEGQWLQKGLRDHIQVSGIQAVPKDAGHCMVSRVQPKYNIERLIRRAQARKQLSYEEAEASYAEAKPSSEKWPFIQMRSQTTKQTFSLFIKQRQLEDQQQGEFSSYGLSSTATVPWF